MKFRLSIVAPSGKIFEDNVDSIAVNGTEGGFEVYANHTPVISALKSGRTRVRQADKVTTFEISSGVLEVDLEHNVTLLADQAILVQA